MDKKTDLNLRNAGFRQAKAITRKYAKSFFFASHFLDYQKKQAAYCVYAICRISDDTVDNNTDKLRLDNLEKLKENIDLAYSDTDLFSEVLLAFRSTVNKYKIPREYFYELLEGMRMDLENNCYKDFSQLYGYCYKVASVIGLILLNIFGYSDPKAQKHAIDLGIAMQLTNILRDIKEDYARGRIYLPQNEMEEHGIGQNYISEGKIDEKFKSFLKFQIKRARQYYQDSEPGIKMIKGLRSRFVVLVMKNIYAAILDTIEKNGYDVFCRRAYVNTPEKTAILLKNLIGGKFL